MITFLSIALIYAVIVLAIAAVGGMLRLRCLKRQQQQRFNFSSIVNESADESMDDLSIENPGSMVSVHTLSKRGSWRVALDQVMSSQTFEEMKAEEYSKKL